MTAKVLMSQQRYEEALQHLRVVREGAPTEASVYMLMGKLCKKLDRLDEAMQHYTTALDLAPKEGNMIKAAIEKLHSAATDGTDDEGGL